jgi:hypothetical protein
MNSTLALVMRNVKDSSPLAILLEFNSLDNATGVL